MNAKRLVVVLLVGAAVVAVADQASARWGPYPPAYVVSPWVVSARTGYVHEHVPYYVLHPPVYYSHVVRRPYGLSPYPYFGNATCADSTDQRPVVIRNRFVATSGPATASPVRSAPQPLRIINPHVVSLDDPGVSRQAVMPRPPQVVHPIAMAERPQ